MTHVVARGLTKRYGSVPVVDDVAFELPSGKLLTFLGPSGSGKTTTLMMIAGFAAPDSGTVEVAGTDITRLPANKRGLGVVFQSYALFPHKTVVENVAFPLEIRRVARAEAAPRIDRILKLVRLDHLADRNVRLLSGGQQQRVALARALVFEPSVLLMDEPLVALDRQLREHMQIEIKNLQRSLDVTAILVTHDQEEAMMMSDIVAIMNGGRIAQIGTPAQVYDEPADRFVAEFLGGVNLFAVRSIQGAGDAIVADIADGMRLPCHSAPGRATTGEWVGVRPERVKFAAVSAPEALFTATVVRQTYLGSLMLHELRTDTGIDFVAKIPLGGDRGLPDVGSVVGISWSPRDAWLLD